MKKLAGLVLGLVILASFSMTSCKKECTCTTTMDGVEYSKTTYETKGKCSELNTSTTSLGVVTEMKCE